jgi:GTP-binding protein Era
MAEENELNSEMAELDLGSLAEEEIPEGHRSGFVAVVGRPNVGKSTLLNAFMKQKLAIVSPRPQTTRTSQLGILTQPTYQIIFVDTPGLVKPRHRLDEFMVGAADEATRDADIILWLVDGAEPPGAADRIIAQNLQGLHGEVPVIVGINKADLIPAEEVIARTEAYRAFMPEAQWILFSALEGRGVAELLALILEALPEGPRYYPVDQTTDLYVRDIAAELVREQIFLRLRDELPYGTAVQIDEFKERENGVTYIRATIYVERDSHKRIVIGRKGAQLRQIGAAARKEIENLVQGQVYLDLWVKVEANWRRDDAALKRLGYGQGS